MTRTVAKAVEVMGALITGSAQASEVSKGRLGRPTSYRPKFCDDVVELMAEGRSLEACAHELGVHPDSLSEWQRQHPEFSAAVREGRAAATAYWEERLRAVANGAPGNAQAIQWGLRNRSRAASGWDYDTQKAGASNPDMIAAASEPRTVLDVDDLSDQELEVLDRVLSKLRPSS